MPGPQGLPILIHRHIVAVKDTGIAAIAAAIVDIGRLGGLWHRV